MSEIQWAPLTPDADRWAGRFGRWADRLSALHLAGLAGTLLEALEPLGPLGAQVLWVAQPTLGLFMPRDDVAALARLLDDPGGMAWIRGQLTGSDGELEHGQ